MPPARVSAAWCGPAEMQPAGPLTSSLACQDCKVEAAETAKEQTEPGGFIGELRYAGPHKHAAVVKAAQLETLALESSRPIIVGRDARPCNDDCKHTDNITTYVALELEQQPRMLSSRHARLELNGRRLLVRDLNSRNGTLVNGFKVSDKVLEQNDVVTFGGASTCEVGAQPSSKSVKSIWQYSFHVNMTVKPQPVMSAVPPHAQITIQEVQESPNETKEKRKEKSGAQIALEAPCEPDKHCADTGQSMEKLTREAKILGRRSREQENICVPESDKGKGGTGEKAAGTPSSRGGKGSSAERLTVRKLHQGQESGILFIKVSGSFSFSIPPHVMS
jgi:hypothetical protein